MGSLQKFRCQVAERRNGKNRNPSIQRAPARCVRHWVQSQETTPTQLASPRAYILVGESGGIN